jgi:protein gp37
MSDFFHEQIADQYRDKAIETIKKTPQHIYQILTKRSWIMKEYCKRIGALPDNVWLGVSVEDSRFKFRIEHLRQTNVRTRFVSAEPLIGPIGSLDLSNIHWVIAGGESGQNHRPCSIEWVRDLRDQCFEANVSFFFKQWGGIKPKSRGRTIDGREWNEFPSIQEEQPLMA